MKQTVSNQKGGVYLLKKNFELIRIKLLFEKNAYCNN